MPLSAGESIAFWSMAVVAVVSSLAVITVKNIFHAAIFLVLVFLAMAGLYVTLQADFVAVVQVLIYAGAISILLVFALLLTRDFQEGNESNRLRGPGTFLGVLVFLTLTMVFMRSSWGHSDGLLRAVPEGGTTAALADALFNKFVLPFEIAALLLLAGIVGAIVLGKET